jgi:dolichyl-phosphate beta-glucosyltransferase
VGAVQKVVVVVPCYNEALRLDEQNFAALLARPEVKLSFVDDGSTDGTSDILSALAARNRANVCTQRLRRNSGKAEAVRRGMLDALASGAQVVGYMDADASTPASEVVRLLDTLEERQAQAVLGARVQLLGSDVRRHRWRHYMGRIFASAASLLLELAVYDTQCGAKVFRDTPALRYALASPFRSRWVFDVELLGRLVLGGPGVAALSADSFIELPLYAWRDVPGSKLSATSMLQSGVELLAIGADLRRARARQKSR